MSKIRRILLSLLVMVTMFGITAIPVSAATTLYNYPQIVGSYLNSQASINSRGLDGSRGTRYTAMNITISTVAVGAVDVAGAVAGDNVTYTDETAAAIDVGGADMVLLPAVPAENDTYYFSSPMPYSGIRIDIGTQGEGVWTIVWEYWNGSAYTALGNVTDGTTGLTAAAGDKNVTWADWPTAWAKRTIAYTGGTVTNGYVVRARVSAYTSVVTSPIGDQAWVLCDNVLTGLVDLTGIAGSESEATGWIGNGRKPQFTLIVKDVENVTGFSAIVQGTVTWDGASSFTGASGRIFGQYDPGNGIPVILSGTFRGTYSAPT